MARSETGRQRLVCGFLVTLGYSRTRPVSFNRARVRELFSLHWPAQQENVIFCGPVGAGETFLACALGHRAGRAAHRVRYVAVTKLLQAFHQSRADNSVERELRSWLAPDLLLLARSRLPAPKKT